jgi:hypothetical protein
MAKTPTLVVSKHVIDDLPEAEQSRLLDAAVKHLPAASRSEFIKRGGDRAKMRDIILAMPLELDLSLGTDTETGGHYAHYPEAAGLGHDCRPNAVSHVSVAGGILRITVVRKIWPGEQVTISDIDPRLPRAERQELHKKAKGTACTCSACTGHGNLGAVAESEANLKEIGELEAELKKERPKATVDMVKRLVELYKKERLESKIAATYELAAHTYNYLGHDKRAQKHAQLARQAWLLEEGPESNLAVAMNILAQDPKGHWSYRYLVK